MLPAFFYTEGTYLSLNKEEVTACRPHTDRQKQRGSYELRVFICLILVRTSITVYIIEIDSLLVAGN